MLKSILITTFRNILKNRSFSLINFIGLSVSMSLALLVILIIREQYSYDSFHQESDRIFRVNTRAIRVSGGTEDYASAPLAIGRILKEDYAFAEEVVRINRRFNGNISYGNVNVPVRGLLTDPSFVKVFNFPLEKGNPSTVLNEPNSLVLTANAAKKIFGDSEPLGQIVAMGRYGDFTVTGVLKELPGKTHFDFEILGSTNAIPVFEQNGIMSSVEENWNDYYTSYIYLKLKPGKSVDAVESALRDIEKTYYSGLKLETRDKGYQFFTLALNEITPGPAMSNQMGTGMPVFLILFLSALVGIVMLMACFNYTNLMVAKSLARTKEIGVRKIVGAKRFQVFVQFIGEAVVFAIISLAGAYLMLQILKPAFLQLNIAAEFATELKEDWVLYLYFLVFAIVVGVVAGLMPAGYLSAFRPLAVLKDVGNLKVYSRLAFRKVLIVTQFTLSIVFIIVVLIIYRQVDFMVTMDYGINDKNILNVRLRGLAYEKLANEMRSLPGVVSVGGVSHQLGTWADRDSDYKRNREDQPFVMRDFIVEENYINNLDLKFLVGKNFDPAEEGLVEKHVILNEKALPLFNFPDPVSAINQPIFVDDSVMLTVIGVVKNFHFRPLSYEIGPLALRYNLNEISFASAKIVSSQKESIIASLEPIWKKLDPIHPLEWKMMDEEIDDAYTRAGFLDVLRIVSYISFLAIMLACLGMLGMAMYSTQIRLKEIGVRKVMGATTRHITVLLSKTFLFMIGIATVIGVPFGYYFGNSFITNYAYRIEITPLLIGSGILIVASLGILTIASQTWRAASSNPVKSLRYE